MEWIQKKVLLSPKSRGFHLVTGELMEQLVEIRTIQVGIAHFFIQHTSASLSLNENADPSVRTDMEAHFNKMVPEHAPGFEHIYEGADDMPAHIKAVMIGSSLSLPITDGRLNLGTWQGIYLCEHRNRGGARKVVATIWGASK